MTSVLFGQSYYLRFDPKLWKARQPYPPLGSLIAAAQIRDLGYRVGFVDSMLAASLEPWKQALESEDPEFAVIFEDSFNYLSKMCLSRMREAALEMIALAHDQGSRIVVCGSDASDHPEIYLEAGAHFIIIGEGEVTLSELLANLTGRDSGGRIEEIAGLAFRSEGSLTRTAPRQVIRDPSALPWAARDLVDIESYRHIWREQHDTFSLNMVTTRGCPYHCNWCAKPIWGQTYHVRDPEDVAREMAHLKRYFGAQHIWFADDILGLKPGWLIRFATAVDATGAGLPFKCLSRADLVLRPGEAEALRAAGAKSVWIGAESGSQKILDAMDKGITVQQIEQATRALRRENIQVGFFLQFGYPGEGRSEVEETLEMVRRCQPDEIGMSVSYPLPGTRFFEMVRQELKEKQNWVDSEDLEMLYQGPFSTEFYRCLYQVLHGEFGLQRHARRMADRSWHQWRPGHLRDVLAWSYRRLKLPMDRRRLDRLDRDSPSSKWIDSGLSFEEASDPTPQENSEL